MNQMPERDPTALRYASPREAQPTKRCGGAGGERVGVAEEVEGALEVLRSK